MAKQARKLDQAQLIPDKKRAWGAGQVLDALKAPYPLESHAWLYEVCSHTGYGRGTPTRFADALVVSTWPSRGIWLGGIEVKVARSDWLRELRSPEKADPIAKFCHYWYIATPPGVVQDGEVPETWGHWVVEEHGKKTRCRVAKQAVRREPEALSPLFLASLLRNAAAGLQRAISVAVQAATDDLTKNGTDETPLKAAQQITALEIEIARLKNEIAMHKRTAEMVETNARDFEKAAGLDEHTIRTRGWHLDNDHVGKHYRLAQALAAHQPPEHLARQLRQVADGLDELVKLRDLSRTEQA